MRREKRLLPATVAHEIYDVLVNICKANPGMRNDFVFAFSDPRNVEAPHEWRFSGDLGFGGKFWWNDERFYVNYYSEDETAEKKRMKQEADELLQAVFSKHFG